MGRKRTCELPFCNGIVEGTHNKRRCDNDRNIHLHQIISSNVKKIMRYIESHEDFTANDVNKALFKDALDKNEKGSMYRLFQAMIREHYIVDKGKRKNLKVYAYSEEARAKKALAAEKRAKRKAEKLAMLSKQEAEEVEILNESAETESEPELQKIDEAPEEKPAKKLSPEESLKEILVSFVHERNGQWNHYDWMQLINRPEIKELGFSEEDIGGILEEEKAAYWARRNG